MVAVYRRAARHASTWAALGIVDDLCRALARVGYKAPTESQEAIVPALLASHRTTVVSARTGTGKTLAVGIPLMQRILDGPTRLPPSTLVLAPNLLLCEQTAAALNKVYAGVAQVKADSRRPSSLARPFSAHIQVTMPSIAMASMLESGATTFDTVVVDEADFMIANGGGQGDCLDKVLTGCKYDRLVFLSATMPDTPGKSPGQVIRQRYAKQAHWVTMPDVDLVMTHVIKGFLETNPITTLSLVSAMQACLLPEDKTLVFCSSSTMAKSIVTELARYNITGHLFTADVDVDERRALLAKFNNGDIFMLVCTDIASRGIDFVDVDHVIQAPLANDILTFVHRLGRAGRLGRSARCTSIYSNKEGQSPAHLVEVLTNGGPISSAFSRNRSLRKKLRATRLEREKAKLKMMGTWTTAHNSIASLEAMETVPWEPEPEYGSQSDK
ncbi:ATP-dependent RNA helicase [Plasmodiophora brassicae]|uniref:ATP-dependent RNA helicase n=1 Tax=Plasmodiophora brassicae TaxID=37360 RepID=A0A0G4J0P0_PLABS|nr:hypothetical protein PBRA_008236 [Plasmodiophora brassicae]SPR01232.1 unnamed protein product [Plasmodiophora brassicae]